MPNVQYSHSTWLARTMEEGVSHAGQEDSEGGEEGRVRVRQPWSRRLLGECTKRGGSAVD